MKTKSKPPVKKAVSKRKAYIVAATSLLIVAILVNSVALLYLFFYRQINRQDNTQIIGLINKAIDNLHKPAVIEPVSGKVYLPDARLVLPAHAVELGDIEYRYSPAIEGTYEEINVTSVKDLRIAKLELDKGAYGDLETAFSAVPRLQSCSRGIRITYVPESENKPVATKKLSNNKTAYFYAEDLCKNPEFLEYVKQIDSY